MTERQRLWRVELPLAAPLLMAGVRTAAVWVIGAATLSTPVGQTSLGNFIFAGLQIQEKWVSVLFGCVAAATLAMARRFAARSGWRTALHVAAGGGLPPRRWYCCRGVAPRGSHAKRRRTRDLRDRQ